MKVLTSPLLTEARSRNPDFPSEVSYWYEKLGPEFGVSVEVAFAQMLHETGWWTFGNAAMPEWNNPAGLGVTGAPDVGIRFSSIELGVCGHYAHLLSYYGEHGPLCKYNPPRPVGRHFGAGWSIGIAGRVAVTDATGHLHLPNDVTELNGRWAQPGDGYGERLAEIVRWLT